MSTALLLPVRPPAPAGLLPWGCPQANWSPVGPPPRTAGSPLYVARAHPSAGCPKPFPGPPPPSPCAPRFLLHPTAVQPPCSSLALRSRCPAPPHGPSPACGPPIGELQVPSRAGPQGKYPLCPTGRCDHREHWARLRTKRSYVFFTCKLCGVGWCAVKTPSRRQSHEREPRPFDDLMSGVMADLIAGGLPDLELPPNPLLCDDDDDAEDLISDWSSYMSHGLSETNPGSPVWSVAAPDLSEDGRSVSSMHAMRGGPQEA